jgi:hypothetical protein
MTQFDGQNRATDATAIPIPKWGPRLARLYSEDVQRLEAIHADRLAPGAKTWEQAVELLFQSMVKAGPVKGTKLVKQAIDYLRGIESDARSHFMIVDQCASRTAFLMFATFRIGPHPDQRVKEQGLSIVLHILQCGRCAPSRATGIPVAYISKHAMARLYERGHDIIENIHAASAFAFAGVLGYIAHRSPKHVDGGLCLLFSDTLMVGSLHRFATTDVRGRAFDETFFDVRTVLAADAIGDSKWSLLEQGRAAASAVIEWLDSEDPPPEEELAERIPRLERREDCYPTAMTRRT